jgi:20S proteasome alpha/beta subunit
MMSIMSMICIAVLSLTSALALNESALSPIHLSSNAPSIVPSMIPSDVASDAPSVSRPYIRTQLSPSIFHAMADDTGESPPSPASSSYGSNSDMPSMTPSSSPTNAPTPRPIGTASALAGEDYVVFAVETTSDLHVGPTATEIFKVTNHTILISSGCRYSVDNIENILMMRSTIYDAIYKEAMTTPTVVKLVSNTIYNQRYSSCFDYNIVVGIDLAGIGAIYNYDRLGQFKRVNATFKGSDSGEIHRMLVEEGVIDGSTNQPLGQLSNVELAQALNDLYAYIDGGNFVTEIATVTPQGTLSSRIE